MPRALVPTALALLTLAAAPLRAAPPVAVLASAEASRCEPRPFRRLCH